LVAAGLPRRCFILTRNYFGKETETLKRTVEGKKVNVKWDWANFRSTKGFPVDP
jgi:hypothetical protein